MIRIINFGLTFGTLYFANQFFPESVFIKDINTVLLATVIMFAVSYLSGWLVILSGCLIPVGLGCLTIIPSLFLAFLSTPIALWLIDKNVNGFDINGFIPFILLWITIGVFSLSFKKAETTK